MNIKGITELFAAKGLSPCVANKTVYLSSRDISTFLGLPYDEVKSTISDYHRAHLFLDGDRLSSGKGRKYSVRIILKIIDRRPSLINNVSLAQLWPLIDLRLMEKFQPKIIRRKRKEVMK